jgi:hypothetical protein
MVLFDFLISVEWVLWEMRKRGSITLHKAGAPVGAHFITELFRTISVTSWSHGRGRGSLCSLVLVAVMILISSTGSCVECLVLSWWSYFGRLWKFYEVGPSWRN